MQSILNGIYNAEKAYEKWSGGEILAYTAEHVLYNFISESIMKISGPKYVEIEPKCKDVIYAACGKRRGRLSLAARPNGHIDILLWWAKDKPRGVIEIKHNVYYYEQCSADIKRIISLLNSRPTTLQFGIFAYYSSASDGKIKTAKEKLTDLYNRILSQIKTTYEKNWKIDGDQKIIEYKDFENIPSAWAGSCVLIKPYK